MGEQIKIQYTDTEIIEYFKEKYTIRRSQLRDYLDKRNYVIGILYHKFNYSENEISKIFNIDRSTVCQSKNKAHDCIYLLKDDNFMRSTRDLRNSFPFNFMKKASLWKSDFDNIVITDFDPDYYYELNRLAKEYKVTESDIAKKLLYQQIDELKTKDDASIL
jgi:hypothetical protein